jgi:ribosomal protein S18 acetylase RimI-like enzyme
VPPETRVDLEAAKALFVEYAQSLGFSLGYQDFEAEMADFPGKYGTPHGALLMAKAEGVPVGAVALRPLEPGICEMKRHYVRPASRGLRTADGRSIGRALAEGIVAAARDRRYAKLRLDTVAGQMLAAVRLYRSLGFVDIPAYYPSPIPGTAYMELDL